VVLVVLGVGVREVVGVELVSGNLVASVLA
jgi:hypothetical protein